jgi:hypothetical protein
MITPHPIDWKDGLNVYSRPGKYIFLETFPYAKHIIRNTLLSEKEKFPLRLSAGQEKFHVHLPLDKETLIRLGRNNLAV